MLGTVGFHLVEGWSLTDSFYVTVQTLTTVGYGDYVPESAAGKWVAAALMLAGVSLIPLITSIVVSIMVAQRTREERESDLRQLDTILERLESIDRKLEG